MVLIPQSYLCPNLKQHFFIIKFNNWFLQAQLIPKSDCRNLFETTLKVRLWASAYGAEAEFSFFMTPVPGRTSTKGALLKEFQRGYSIHIWHLTVQTGCSKQVQGGSLWVLRALVLRLSAHGAAGAHHSTHATICTCHIVISFARV